MATTTMSTATSIDGIRDGRTHGPEQGPEDREADDPTDDEDHALGRRRSDERSSSAPGRAA